MSCWRPQSFLDATRWPAVTVETHLATSRYHTQARFCTRCRFAGFGHCTAADTRYHICHREEPTLMTTTGLTAKVSSHWIFPEVFASNIIRQTYMNFYGEIKFSILSGFNLSMTIQLIFLLKSHEFSQGGVATVVIKLTLKKNGPKVWIFKKLYFVKD